MKTKTLKSLFVLPVMLLILAACTSRVQQVADECNKEAAQTIAEFDGLYQDIQVTADGKDLVMTYTFSKVVDLGNVPQQTIEQIKAEALTTDFSSEFTPEQQQIFREENSDLILIYKDDYGHEIKVTVPNSQIIN